MSLNEFIHKIKKIEDIKHVFKNILLGQNYEMKS